MSTESKGGEQGPASASSAVLGAGRFRVGERLGQGAAGIVYRAFDAELGIDVALKMLPSAGPEEIFHLKREFRAVAGMSHRHLVELYDLFVDAPACFFTMELVRGATFVERIRDLAQSGRSREEVLWSLLEQLHQLALGVSAIHAAGRLHRDLKPANILVTPEGRVVVLDFGLATARAPDALQPVELAGTPAYMAPEQMWGEAVTPAADWYSVGVVAYECLAGSPPFASPHMAARGARRPARVQSDIVDVPPWLSALVISLLDPDPAARPSGAAILARLTERADLDAPLLGARSFDDPFVGRADELAALHAALGAVASGATRVVHVYGLSGIGKTELVNRFTLSLIGPQRAEPAARTSSGPQRAEPAALVLRSRCHPRESVPYKALDGVIDDLSRFLVLPRERAVPLPRDADALLRLFPVLGRALLAMGQRAALPAANTGDDVIELRRRGVDALRELLSTLGEARPVVLWIDDLQWGDLDSLQLLRGLLGPPAPPRLLVVASYRSEDLAASPLLKELRNRPLEQSGVERIELSLAPLSAADIERLARRLSSHLGRPGADVADLGVEAAGSPLFVAELVRHAAAFGASGAGTPRRLGLSEVVLDRLQRLPPKAARVLELASVAATPIGRDVVLEAAGLGAAGRPLLTVLENQALLRRAFSLREGAGGEIQEALTVYHDRIRETVTAALDGDALRDRHRALVAVLRTAADPDPDALVSHCLGAGLEAEAATHALAAAARAEATLAFDKAAELYAVALKPHAEGSRERAALDLHARRAEALSRAGRLNEAADVYERCSRIGEERDREDFLRRSVENSLTAGNFTAALPALHRLLDGVGLPRLSSQPAVLARLGWEVLAIARHPLSFTPRDHLPESERRRLTICFSALRGFTTYDTLRGAVYAFLYLRLSLAAGDRAHLTLAAAYAGTILAMMPTAFADELRGRVMALARRCAGEQGDPELSGAVALSEAQRLVFHGAWEEGHRRVQAALPLLTRQGRFGAERDTAEQLSLIALERMGELREMRVLAERLYANGELRGVGAAVGKNALWRALGALAGDDPGRAQRFLDEAERTAPGHAFLFQHWMVLRLRVLCLLYQGAPARAADVLREGWPKLGRSGLLSLELVRVPASKLSALCAVKARRDPGLVRSWSLRAERRIAEELLAGRAPYASAGGHLVSAALAQREDRPGAARDHLATAAELYRRAGMKLHALAAERLIAAAGDDRRELHRVDAEMVRLGVSAPSRFAGLFGIEPRKETR